MRTSKILVLLLLTLVTAVNAATLNLAWDASPDPAVAGYRIYYSPVGGALQVKDAGNATTTSINVSNGLTYNIYATAYATNNIESEPSNTLTYGVPDTLPGSSILLSSTLVQTNGTFRIKVDWQPAPFQESVTGYKLDVLTNGVFFTNIWTTNLSATFTVNQKLTTTAWLSKSNFFGLSASNFVSTWKQPVAPRMATVWQTN